MSHVRYIADLHLGHKNMAIKRGFKGHEDHDQHIIKTFNKHVSKNDTTYILGDVGMESTKFYHLLDELNGRIIVVGGNHEKRNHVTTLQKHCFQFTAVVMRSIRSHGVKAFLTHIPVHPMELNYRIGLNIHGHLHEGNVMKSYLFGLIKRRDKRYICVSCEQLDYIPRDIEYLLKNNK